MLSFYFNVGGFLCCIDFFAFHHQCLNGISKLSFVFQEVKFCKLRSYISILLSLKG